MSWWIGLLKTCMCMLLAACLPAEGTLIPRLDPEALCATSDVVVSGTVRDVKKAGRTTIQTPGGELGSDLMVATLDVESVLKGKVPESRITFQFPVPDAPAGYGVVVPSEFGLFFLRSAGGTFEVVDFYHPYVVAASGVTDVEGTCVEKVIRRLSALFQAGVASVYIRRKAVEVLETLPTPGATAGLRLGAQDPDANTRLLAVSALISRSDLSFLPTAVDTLVSPTRGLDPYVAFRLAHAIEFGVKKEQSIPQLGRLLGATDIHARRAAAGALRSTRAYAAIEPLTKTLYDNDREVRYQAVIGLAEITGTIGEWAPAYDTYLKDEKRYLDHWREWAKSMRKQTTPENAANK